MIKWNQLNIVQKGILEKIFTYGGVLLVSLMCLGLSSCNKYRYYNSSQQTNQIEKVANNKRYQHEKKMQQEVIGNTNHSNNPVIKSIGQNRVLNEKPLPIIKQFFTGYYTYNSNSTYQSRQNRIRNIVTSNVLKNHNIFNPHYTGYSSVLSNISSTVMSSNGNNENLLVECHITTWKIQGARNIKKSLGQWLSVSYNKQNNKITNIQRLYTNNDNSSNDFNTTSTTQSGSGVYY